jgi:hypothetical protein
MHASARRCMRAHASVWCARCACACACVCVRACVCVCVCARVGGCEPPPPTRIVPLHDITRLRSICVFAAMSAAYSLPVGRSAGLFLAQTVPARPRRAFKLCYKVVQSVINRSQARPPDVRMHVNPCTHAHARTRKRTHTRKHMLTFSHARALAYAPSHLRLAQTHTGTAVPGGHVAGCAVSTHGSRTASYRHH